MMRKAVILALVLGVPLLSGCGMTNDVFGPSNVTLQKQKSAADQQRLGQLTQDIDACTAKRKLGQPTAHVDYALCINAAFESAMFDIQYPYPDSVATLSADRLRVAELLDKRQITDAEARARINDKISDVVRLEEARNNNAGDDVAVEPQVFLQLMQVGL
jgi:hypothetical protein